MKRMGSTARVVGVAHDRHKRAFEVVATPIAIAAASPLLALLALAVFVTSGRPVLYRGKRVGRDERLFEQLKFRTMREEIDVTGRVLGDGDRITWFGRYLRKTSLDELPQLFNILRGDMSFVGPRPLPERYLGRYDDVQRLRHVVRPGLTGLAQTAGRNQLPWTERFELDVRYVDEANFRLDARILKATVRMVASGRGISAENYATAPEFLGSADPTLTSQSAGRS